MDKIRIKGGIPLKGTIHIGGAKNAVLPLMAASLLTEETLTLSNVPHLVDITTMANLLVQHGVDFTVDGCEGKDANCGRVINLQAAIIDNLEAPYDIVRKMRASVLVLGPLLARYGKAKVSLPGGCAIGARPIGRHLDALERMGVTVSLDNGYIDAHIDGKLQGAEIYFDDVSVGATENILMAACLAEGETVIHNAAREPEVIDLAECLVKMGAKIDGIGRSKVIVQGMPALHGATHQVIPDRIEAGTYMAAAAVTGGDITLEHVNIEHLQSVIDKFQKIGIEVTSSDDQLRINAEGKRLKSIDIETSPYPGFPTDMQAQMMALMCVADGTAVITENIFENRYMHVPELTRMGANISVNGKIAMIKGVEKLLGAPVMATDLRASVSLVLAGLAAGGETLVSRVYHLDRGYERLEEKLAACGARIERVKG